MEEETVSVPIPVPPSSAEVSEEISEEPIGDQHIEPQERSAPLIVVADDDNNFREVVVAKLTASGFSVEPARNGDEALKKTVAMVPDLVVLDISMPPGPTGVEIAFQIKKNPATSHVKVMFLSGQDDPWPAMAGDKAAVSKEFGMEDFITKTEDLDVLVAKVRVALGIQ